MTLSEALRLIVITDGELAKPRSVEEVVKEVLQAGVRAIQLQGQSWPRPETLLAQAQRLRETNLGMGALLFINDRFDVALAAEADGVHLGPDDLPVETVRGAITSRVSHRASTDIPSVAMELQAAGADYIGCGAVFPTTTKKDAGEVIGIEGLEAVAAVVDIPVVGIGGVTSEGAHQIAVGSGAVGVAVIGAVMTAQHPATVARALMAPFGG